MEDFDGGKAQHFPSAADVTGTWSHGDKVLHARARQALSAFASGISVSRLRRPRAAWRCFGRSAGTREPIEASTRCVTSHRTCAFGKPRLRQIGAQGSRLLADMTSDAWLYTAMTGTVRSRCASRRARGAHLSRRTKRRRTFDRLFGAVKIVGVVTTSAYAWRANELNRVWADASCRFTNPYYIDITIRSPNRRLSCVSREPARHRHIGNRHIGDMPNDVLMFRASGFHSQWQRRSRCAAEAPW